MELQPGETRTVEIHLDFRAFAYYHPAYGRWITEDGAFDILIGASAADIRCVQTVTLESTLQLPCILDRDSTLRDWLDDPRGKAAIAPLAAEIRARTCAVFGDEQSEASPVGIPEFLLDMPLPNVLEFDDYQLPVPPVRLVDDLLRQAHAND